MIISANRPASNRIMQIAHGVITDFLSAFGVRLAISANFDGAVAIGGIRV